MLIIYSDPHQGLDLRANTTPRSRARLDDAIRSVALGVTLLPPDKSAKEYCTVCVGDFFHRFSNPESVILDALPVARRTDYILGGNHDVMNDESRISSLKLLKEMGVGADIIMPSVATPTVHAVREHIGKNEEEVLLVFVPHHGTKESFRDALKNAKELADKEAGMKSLLFLHCNYDCPVAEKDTEMNLSREEAADLLDSFTWIFIGHDHHPKDDFFGRLQVVGNIHPTGFSDCDTDKRCITLDHNADGKLELRSAPLWDTATGYAELTVDQLDTVDPTVVNFVRITGKVSPSDISHVSRKIKELFDHPDSEVYAVKSELKVVTEVTADEQFETAEELASSSTKVTEIITRELQRQNPELLDLWLTVINSKGE